MLNIKNLINTNQLLCASVLTLGIGILLMPLPASANGTDWQPISSERLMKLPAGIMGRALEYDFRESGLASKIKHTDSQLSVIQHDLAKLKQEIETAEGEWKIELQHQFLEQKSGYLDQMEQQQGLRRQELQTRLDVYRRLLSQLQKDNRRGSDPVAIGVREKQLAARSRMESIVERVDEVLFEQSANQQSDYAKEYSNNIGKIKQLQAAIRQHELQRSLIGDGEALTRDAYIRQLLQDAQADIELLNQEDEMLGYMARLVALDAQALQIELTYGDIEEGHSLCEQ